MDTFDTLFINYSLYTLFRVSILNIYVFFSFVTDVNGYFEIPNPPFILRLPFIKFKKDLRTPIYFYFISYIMFFLRKIHFLHCILAYSFSRELVILTGSNKLHAFLISNAFFQLTLSVV